MSERRLIEGIYARATIAQVLNTLPMVRWDRLTFDDSGDPPEAAVYGWIEREDGRADFVLLQFDVFDLGARWRDYFSSSADRSDEIYRLLTGLPEVVDGAENGHISCERVEDVIGDFAKNAIRLGEGRLATAPTARFWGGDEVLAELYASVREDRERTVLDGLVVKPELGWRCQAPLKADDGEREVPCSYLNVPGLGGKGETSCVNCGAPRSDRG